MHVQMCEKGHQFMEEWDEADELLKENPRVMLLGSVLKLRFQMHR